MDLLFKTKKTIEKHGLIDAGDSVLIGVSGGIDSMVLLHVLNALKNELGFFLAVAHINHGLRGKDSDGDETFVLGHCKNLNIPIHTTKWEGLGKGENLQETARNFRYEFFSKTAKRLGYNKIVLAHNLEDQAETVLLNLIRGAGLDGLCGMDFKRTFFEEAYMIRPFLNINREEIELAAKTENVNFRHDMSNDKLAYTRNFIRHKIVPLIQQINPNATNSIGEMADLLKLDENYMHARASDALASILETSDSYSIFLDGVTYQNIERPIRLRILKLAYVKLNSSVAGITKDHILKMDEIARSTGHEGSYNLPNMLKFEKRGTKLAILKN